MPPVIRQFPTIIIPTTGLPLLVIADAAIHYSNALEVWSLQEKEAEVVAVMVAAPGPLNIWVEISAWGLPGTWVPLGIPAVLVATGGVPLPWQVHSEYARIGVQAPVWAAGAWAVTVSFQAKTP